jgi:hypothetical protein
MRFTSSHMIIINEKVLNCVFLFCTTALVLGSDRHLKNSAPEEATTRAEGSLSHLPTSRDLVSPEEPSLWNPNFRLAGVTTINQTQTAHFSDLIGSATMTLTVGEVLPGGLTLLSIENPDDPYFCKAIIGHRSDTIEVITIEAENADVNNQIVYLPPQTQPADVGSSVEEDRIAVRPFSGPRSW